MSYSIWRAHQTEHQVRQAINKRIKLRHQDDRTYIQQRYDVPQGGYPLGEDSKEEKGIVFYRKKETEYFKPEDRRLLHDPVELYKAGLIVDRVHGVKRLKEPQRWCTLPESETVTIEVPLTQYEHSEYKKEVVQELGHVAWHKAYFHVDKEVYEPEEVDVEIRQVLQKVTSKSLPRWRPKNRYWDEEFIGAIEIPGTVFCTERALIKKLKFCQGDTPDVVHKRDVSQVERDTIGCSVFRRHQPPRWTYPTRSEDEESDKIWNGLESRNQWVYESLYNIWAGEQEVHGYGYQWRERVYWTGPVRHFDRDEYLCHHYPYCTDIVEDIEVDEENIVVVLVVDGEL